MKKIVSFLKIITISSAIVIAVPTIILVAGMTIMNYRLNRYGWQCGQFAHVPEYSKEFIQEQYEKNITLINTIKSIRPNTITTEIGRYNIGGSGEYLVCSKGFILKIYADKSDVDQIKKLFDAKLKKANIPYVLCNHNDKNSC